MARAINVTVSTVHDKMIDNTHRKVLKNQEHFLPTYVAFVITEESIY